jgi:hypothetical protein
MLSLDIWLWDSYTLEYSTPISVLELLEQRVRNASQVTLEYSTPISVLELLEQRVRNASQVIE